MRKRCGTVTGTVVDWAGKKRTRRKKKKEKKSVRGTRVALSNWTSSQEPNMMKH